MNIKAILRNSLLAAWLAVLACWPARAQTTLYWDANATGTGPSDGAGTWDIGNYWWNGSADVAWTPGANAVFGNGGTGDAVALSGPITVNSLTMNSFSATNTLGTVGQTIALNNGITNNSTAGATTLISPLTLGAAQTWVNNSTNRLTLSDVDNGGFLVSVGGSGNTRVSGSLFDTGGLTMNGPGTLTLAGANTYSGDTTVNAGTLVGTNGISAVAGTTRFNVAGGANLVLYGSLAQQGNANNAWPAATVTGAGTVTLPLGGSANVGVKWDMSAFTGILDLTNGMLCVNATYSPGFVGPTNGAIRVEDRTALYLGWTGYSLNTTVILAGTIDNGGFGLLRGDTATQNGAVILATNSTIGGTGNFPINGVISDGGKGFGFTKVSTGTVILNGTNTYSGPTIVSSATLQCNNTNALGNGGALSISTGGAKVNLNYTGEHVVALLTLGGVVQLGGTTYGSSSSTAANQNDTYFSGTGVVRVPPSSQKDILTFSFGALGGPTIIGTNITMIVPGGTDVTHLAPTYTVSVGATGSPVSSTPEDFTSPVTYTVTAQDGSTKQYLVTVTFGVLADLLTWTNTVSGNYWSVAANWTNELGLLQAPIGGGRPSYTLNFNAAGTYTANNDLSAGFMFNQLNLGGPTLTLSGNGLAFAANGATLPQLSQNSAVTCTINNSLTLATNITVGGSGAGQVTLVGAMSGPGSLTKTNRGQLRFTGGPSYTGGTHVIAGTLYLNAAATGFAPNAAAFTMSDVTVESGATLEGFRAHIVGGKLTMNGGTYFEFNGYNDGAWDGPIYLAADSYFGQPIGNCYGLTLRGQISGPGGFTFPITNSSTLTLTASNSYAGPTIVTGGTLTGGTLNCNNRDALGTGALSINSPCVVNLNYTGNHFITSLTIDGTVYPPGTYGASTGYTVNFAGAGTVTVPGPANIIAFAVPGALSVVIDPVAMTIAVGMPPRTPVTQLAPTYTLSSGMCDHASGGTYDFTSPVIYTVTDGATVNPYTVTVTVPPTYVWKGPNGGNWSAATNWDNTVPGTNNVAVFSDSASAGATVNLDTDVSIAGLQFNNLVPSQTIASTGNHTLTLSSNYVVVQGGTLSISCPINATTIYLTERGAGTLNIGGALTTGVGQPWATPIINGAGGIILSGTGSWTDTSGSYMDVASGSGTGTLTINDSATLDWTKTGSLCIGFYGGNTGKVVQNGGTVITPPNRTAWWNNNGPGIMMGSYDSTASTAEYDLNGGTLRTCNIYNINEDANSKLLPPAGPAIFRFNGGTLKATEGDSTIAAVVTEGTTNLMGNLTHAYVGLGGAKIDVATFNCGINQALEHDPALGTTNDGGLHVMSTGGAGTLALYKLSTFTGPLAIDAGVMVNLGYTGDQRVASVSIGGANQGMGTFGVGQLNPGGVFTGTGTVTVLPAAPPTPVLPTSSFSYVAGGVPTFTGIATVSGYTYYLVWKNNLTDAGWTRITPGTVSTGSPITLTDPSPGPQHRFYRIEVQ